MEVIANCRIMSHKIMILFSMILLSTSLVSAAELNKFFRTHCFDCHAGESAAAGLNLKTLARDFENQDVARRWVRVHDRIASGEMPPRDADQPTKAERNAIVKSLSESLIAGDRAMSKDVPRLRRLTRTEYENTIRDLFDMPGIALAGNLPADGSAHGFDKHPEALDISHVNVAKYLEAADHILNYAIATRPEPPTIHTRRISLVNRGGFVAHIVMNGDGILLKNKQPDPDFPPAGEQNHLDQGAHERWGSFRNGATVGLFRHEDESVSPYFSEHVTIYPARYRVRTSLWSFQWDKGKMLPGRGTEAARLSVVQLTGDGRGGQHPSYVLGYFDAPDTNAIEHEIVVWMNHNEQIGFNTASLAPAANYYKKKRAMEFTGPGISVDWLDVEGPLYESWPPTSHRVLFGDLPLDEFKAADHPGVRTPRRVRPRQIGAGQNRPDSEPGVWTVSSNEELKDADRLLAAFLPKLFRRPVSEDVRKQYVEIVKARLETGDCFELAMRAACRNALVSPDFLYHIEPHDSVDDYALACRLSYFLWNSMPDEQLATHAATGRLREPKILHSEVERLLQHPRSKRFVDDFLGQWLKLYQIAATDPDRKLYPEFNPYLQDSMVAETRAFFRELLDKDLDTSHLMKSDFVMINQKLATHYGIPDVTGTKMRRVPLPEDCPRGGVLTQASILKITANGTTTSPVPRGAFVIGRLLGEPPEPPPANVAAIEPDVRGATTIREQLAKHRDHAVCASCHRRIDPPGFALESFDVIGGFRNRYRSIGDGDLAERGSIDPFIGISFKLGQTVDSSGELHDGRGFEDIRKYQSLLASDSRRLLSNLAKQFSIYGTGRAVRFSDRPLLDAIVNRTQKRGGGIRTLLHELVGSPLFTRGAKTIDEPARSAPVIADPDRQPRRVMMTATLPPIASPATRPAPVQPSEPPAKTFQFDDDHSVKLRVVGLFMSDRVDDFRELMKQFPEASLLTVDFDTATIRYAADSGQFRNAKPEQIVERLNNRVRQLSTGLFSLKPIGPIPREKLKQIEFPIKGLACKACSLAVHDILARVEGVEHVTASFRDSLATAWVDPARTDRAKLEAALKQRGVTLIKESPEAE
jgi:copper chaperone CopZ